MNCTKCGQSQDDQASFCSRCGAALVAAAAPAAIPYASSVQPQTSGDQPILVLRPTFIGWPTILFVGPVGCFAAMTVFISCLPISCLFSFLGSLVLPSGSTVLLPGIIQALLALAAFVGAPLGLYLLQKRAYSRTEYRFYADRLDYYCGFISIRQASIRYRNVVEVQLRQGVIQKRYGVGTLLLSTAAGGMQQASLGSVSIQNVPNPDVLYGQIQQLIRAAQGR